MSKKITYEDKIAIYNDPDVPEESKVTDENMNNIKEVVNNNADELDEAKKTAEQAKETAEGIKPYDDSTLKKEIDNLKEEDKRLEQSIPKNTSDLNNDSKFQTEEEVTESIGQAKKEFTQSQEKQDTNITKLQEENEMLKGLLPTVTGKGTDVTLKGTGEMPFKKFEISGNAIQDGEPSPENKVPIKICGDNINLFDKDTAQDASISTSDGVTIKPGDGSGKISDYIEVEPNTNYFASSKIGNAQVRIFYYDSEKQYLGNSAIDFRTGSTYTSNKNTHYVRLQFGIVYFENLKFEKGTKSTLYTPFGYGCMNVKVSDDGEQLKEITIPTQQPMLKGDYFDGEK